MLEANKKVGLEVNINKTIYIWLCVLSKMRDNIAVYWLQINPLWKWQISIVWEKQ
jgi:hypothetical protein